MATIPTWDDLSVNLLRGFIRQRFDYEGIATALKADLQAYLVNFGFEPNDVLGRTNAPVPQVLNIQQGTANPKPPEQKDGESIDDFLRALQAYFSLVNTPVAKQAPTLLATVHTTYR